MPRPRNYLDHEDFPPEDDNYGWDQPPGTTYDVPVSMERMGMLDLPDWMRTEDGSCDVDYRAGMGHDKPDLYCTSLGQISPGEETALPRQPLCRYFAKNGRCKYGEHCYFEHETAASAAAAGDVKRSRWVTEKEVKKSYEQSEREAREKREDEQGKKVKVCRFFDSEEGCKWGLSCLNRHVK